MSIENELHQERKRFISERLPALLEMDLELNRRFQAVRGFSSRVRASEYHLTNACNIRCKGCWFFEFGHDKTSEEVKELEEWTEFVKAERKRRVNCALLIGGEPTLFPERIEAFVENMKFVSISTNGIKPFPNTERFKDVTVFVTLFGGGPLDDELRGIKPSGRKFEGLFETSLKNYKNDPRVTFVFAVTETGISYIEETVARIRANGNRVTFNFYSQYNTGHPLKMHNQKILLDKMLAIRARYPDTVLNHPAHIEAMVTGKSWCGEFGYDVCPSVSQDHPDNAARLQNGNPGLTFFNTYKADLKTLELCCTSGHCTDCRDSQAIYSWMLVSLPKSLESLDHLRNWVEVAESYWSQFIWSPYHASKVEAPEQEELAA